MSQQSTSPLAYRHPLHLVGALLLLLSVASVVAVGAAAHPETISQRMSADSKEEGRLAGVHDPIPINPVVVIDNARWLFDLYQTLLDRPADPTGFQVNFADLEAGTSRQSMFNALVNSAEFQSQLAKLGPRSGFVDRAYQRLLLRTPSPQEVNNWVSQMQTWAGGDDNPLSWIAFLADIYGCLEFKEKQCVTSYYSFGAPVNPGSLLLRDIFAGTAKLQSSAEAQPLSLTIPSASAIWDQKMPVIRDPENPVRLIAFTRSYNAASQHFTLPLLESSDGIAFTEVAPLWAIGPSTDFYDGHLSIDYSRCPTMYVLTMECVGNGGAASLCISESPTPGRYYSWTWPTIVVDGCTGGRPSSCGTQADESASTGVAFIDGFNKYIAWTQVYDGLNPPNDPLAHTYSQMVGGPFVSAATTLRQYYGTVMGPSASGAPGVATMLSSDAHPWCTDAWDCNNRDKQDWKREGSYVYVLYNGADYYRCNGAWGISISRSPVPNASPVASGPYNLISPGVIGNRPLIAAMLNNTCGISYPVLNVIDGEVFVYYADHYLNTQPVMFRSRIVPGRG